MVLLNRPSDRADAAFIKLASLAPGAAFTAVECDLQSFASVRAAAAQLHAKFSSTGIDGGVRQLMDSQYGPRNQSDTWE